MIRYLIKPNTKISANLLRQLSYIDITLLKDQAAQSRISLDEKIEKSIQNKNKEMFR